MKKKILLGVCIAFSNGIHTQEKTEEGTIYSYVDKKFLGKGEAVKKQLCSKDGFCPITFQTKDNLTIHGLLRSHSDAQATVIAFAGFYPGRKEGMAILTDILPKNKYNILLVDVRGHGESGKTSLWLDLPRLGAHEYYDVIAALDFVHKKTDQPIIIYGLCAGAFHAARALINLQPKQVAKLKVSGLIFDSGWASLCEIVPRTVRAEIQRRVPTTFLKRIANAIFNVIYWIMYERSFTQTDKCFNLYDLIDQIEVPVFYIHAADDAYSPISCCKRLTERTKNNECWIVPKSRHAHNYLMQTQEFSKKVYAFCNRIVEKQNTKSI